MRVKAAPRFWAFVIAMTLLVFMISFGVLQHRYGQVTRQLQQARAYRDSLRLEVAEREDELAFAQTDAYVERIARDELGMLMPGELRYVNGAR